MANNRFSKRQTSTADQAVPPGTKALSALGLNDWPASWCATDCDIQPGEQIVACFRPFLEYLAATHAPKTIRKHADNLWILGGGLIRDLNQTSRLRKTPVEALLSDLVQYGGPLPQLHSEEHLRSFESTCNKFRRFLQQD